MKSLIFKFWYIFIILFLIPAIGTLGFMTIEGWRFIDALYMSVITISTVGFQEVHPLSDSGRIFAILYLIVGLSTFLYTISELGEKIVHEGVAGWFSYLKRGNNLKDLKGHFIICGAGRVGSTLAEDLFKRGLDFVVIDKSTDLTNEYRDKNWKVLCADATEDETLISAGIHHAKGLAAVLGTDSDNLYVTLSARMIRPDMQIIRRSSDQKTTEKIKLAGANKVVSLYKTGASRMAQLLANDKLQDFVEIFSDEGGEMDMAEFPIENLPSLNGKTIAESNVRSRGLMVIGIRRTNGKIDALPSEQHVMRSGDYLIAVGRSADIHSFSESLT